MSKLSRRSRQATAQPRESIRPFEGLERIQPSAAGVDIGAHEIMVCVPGPENTQIVRAFGSYTADLQALADWLHSHDIKTVAMESTGVYWIPPHSKNLPQGIQVRTHLLRITGIDLLAVPGISASLAQTIVAEIGSDMSRFPTVKHFGSWLGLAPHNDISGGRVLRSRTLNTHNRAGQAFIQAAAALIRSDTIFGAFYRRLKSRVGPSQALIATAHKLARVVYMMLQTKAPYVHVTAQQAEQLFRAREIAYLQRKAAKLGLVLSPQPGDAVS